MLPQIETGNFVFKNYFFGKKNVEDGFTADFKA